MKHSLLLLIILIFQLLKPIQLERIKCYVGEGLEKENWREELCPSHSIYCTFVRLCKKKNLPLLILVTDQVPETQLLGFGGVIEKYVF